MNEPFMIDEALALLPIKIRHMRLLRMSERGEFPPFVRPGSGVRPIFNRNDVLDWVEKAFALAH